VDLRDDLQVRDKLAKQRMTPVSKADGEKMARELGAVKYVECSALTQYKLTPVEQARSVPDPMRGARSNEHHKTHQVHFELVLRVSTRRVNLER